MVRPIPETDMNARQADNRRGELMKRMVTRMALFLLLCPGVPALAGSTASGTPTGQQGSVDERQLQKLQDRMLSDSQVMALISALQNDPDLQALLKDPSFLQALSTRDVNTLANDPRFVKLFGNPLIKKIIQLVE
jgi:hypothetical protein